MARYDITNESTEDTITSTDDLEEAVRMAREAARQGPIGDAVSVECGGKAVRQFVLLRDGTVAEQSVAHSSDPCSSPPLAGSSRRPHP